MKLEIFISIGISFSIFRLSYCSASSSEISGNSTNTSTIIERSSRLNTYSLQSTCSDLYCAECIDIAVLNKLQHSSYHKELRPRPKTFAANTSIPTLVKLSAFILDIIDIDDKLLSWTVNLVLRQSWKDYRLRYKVENCPTYRYLTLSSAQDIWKPVLYFATEKEALLHSVPEPNVMVRIKPSGSIILSQRLTVRLSCDENGDGEIICPLRPSSYSYSSDELELRWTRKHTIQFYKRQVLNSQSEFTVGEIELGEDEHNNLLGSYRSVYANFHFVKKQK